MRINSHFGTYRGLLRLALSYWQLGLKQADIVAADARMVRRVVFVCHGNICRSAFADHYARQLGIDAASFGLSTSSGKPAYPGTSAIAVQMGVDLSDHLTTAAEDFVPQPGDLLLAMEVRQLSKIAADPALRDYPRSLLGLYTTPPLPHLHDPYKLDPAYMPICLGRIKSAVDALKVSFPGASAGR